MIHLLVFLKHYAFIYARRNRLNSIQLNDIDKVFVLILDVENRQEKSF